MFKLHITDPCAHLKNLQVEFFEKPPRLKCLPFLFLFVFGIFRILTYTNRYKKSTVSYLYETSSGDINYYLHSNQ